MRIAEVPRVTLYDVCASLSSIAVSVTVTLPRSRSCAMAGAAALRPSDVVASIASRAESGRQVIVDVPWNLIEVMRGIRTSESAVIARHSQAEARMTKVGEWYSRPNVLPMSGVLRGRPGALISAVLVQSRDIGKLYRDAKGGSISGG